MNELEQLRSQLAADLGNVQATTMQREQRLIAAIGQIAHAVERLGSQMEGGLPNDVRNALQSAVGTARSVASEPRVRGL